MTRTERNKPDSWWRRLLWQPFTWGTVCLLIALPWFVDGFGFEPVPAILSIVGGALCGVGITSAIGRISSPTRSLIVHSAVAVLLALQILWVASVAREAIDRLPDPIRGTLTMLGFASLPAAAWIWMALWTRAIWAGDAKLRRKFRRGRPAADPAPAPTWKLNGDNAELRFAAIPMHMRTLVVLIIATAFSIAAAVTLTLIAVDVATARLPPPRLTVIIIGGLYGTLAYVIGSRFIRHQTKPCRVRFAPERVRVEWGSRFWDRPYAEIDMIRWRCKGEYARLEIRGSDRTISLIAGLSAPQKSSVRQARPTHLPEPPERVVNWLEDAGIAGAQSAS